MNKDIEKNISLLKIADVRDLLNISRTVFYELCKEDDFPPAIIIGKSKRWRLNDIEKYIKSRIEVRYKDKDIEHIDKK